MSTSADIQYGFEYFLMHLVHPNVARAYKPEEFVSYFLSEDIGIKRPIQLIANSTSKCNSKIKTSHINPVSLNRIFI